MRLIHCHHQLKSGHIQRLLDLLTEPNSCVVLREKALLNCANTEIMNQLNNHAKVYILGIADTDKLPEKGTPQAISNQQFVELCIEAQQVTGWH